MPDLGIAAFDNNGNNEEKSTHDDDDELGTAITSMVNIKREPEDLQCFYPNLYVRASFTPELEEAPTDCGQSDPTRERSGMEMDSEEDNAHSPILVAKDAELQSELEMKVCLFDMDRDATVTLTGRPILEHVLEMRRGLDTVITLKDGQLGAHRMVLTAASPFLGEMLRDQNSKGKATLLIPDVTVKIMERLLNLAYTGKMYYSQDEMEDVFSAMGLLYFAEYADLSVVKVTKRERPSCSFQAQGFLGPVQLPADVVEQVVHVEDTSEATLMGNNRFQCNMCPRNFSSQRQLNSHQDHAHYQAIEKISFEEIQKLTHCDICNVQWKTLERSQKHLLTKHEATSCWICLEPVAKKEQRAHYFSYHREDLTSPSNDFSVQCRWCTRIINFKGNSNCNAINSHGHAHLPSLPTSKNGGKNSPKQNEFSFKIPVGRAPRSRNRLSPDSREERFLGRICDPPNFILDEVTKKCRIDLNKLPSIAFQLERLSRATLAQYSRSRSSTASVPPPATGNEDVNNVSARLLSIDPIFEAEMNGYDEMFPEHFLFATEKTDGTEQVLETTLDLSVDGSIPKRKRRATVPSTPMLSLITQDWGQVNLSVHHVSESLLKANFMPGEGILLIGRVSHDFIWDKIDNMHKNMDLTILRLIPNCGEEEKYTSLHKHLSTNKRMGVLSGPYPAEVADSYIFALNKEGFNRQSLARFHGPGFSESAGHATSLLMVIIRSTSAPVPNTKRGRKSKKRCIEPVKTGNPTTTVEMNDEKLLSETHVQAGKETILTDPEILVDVQMPQVEKNPVSASPHTTDEPQQPQSEENPVPLDQPSYQIRQMYKRILRPQDSNLEQDKTNEDISATPVTPNCSTAPVASIRPRSKRLSTAPSGEDSSASNKRKQAEDKKRHSPRWKQTKLSFSPSNETTTEAQSIET